MRRGETAEKVDVLSLNIFCIFIHQIGKDKRKKHKNWENNGKTFDASKCFVISTIFSASVLRWISIHCTFGKQSIYKSRRNT